MIKDDRTKSQQVDLDVPLNGLGDDLRSFLAELTANKPARTRNLLPIFRPVPGIGSGSGHGPDPGFPGTKAFAPRRTNRGEAGPALQPARSGSIGASAPAAGSDDSQGRHVAVQPARKHPSSLRPAQPAAKGSTGGRVRGRGGADRASTETGSGAGAKKELAGTRGRVGRPKKDKAPTLPKAIAKLVPKSDTSSPSKLIPTEAERSDARRLFREIGETFNSNRKKSKTAAYAAFRHDLMANLDTLIMGGAIDLKEATSIITNLEQYTKETEAESTETPATILGRWLRMDASEAAGLSVPAEEVVEDEENLDEVEEEEPAETETADAVQDIFI